MPARLTTFSYKGKSIVTTVFIETGTFRGETVINAIRAGFPRLLSIEFLRSNYELAKERLKEFSNVKLFLGSSPEILPTILDRSLPTTFWLDAHYQGSSGSELDPKYGECPLLAELDAIFKEPWKVLPIILIDDANMFDGRAPKGFDVKQWPSVKDITSHFPTGYSIEMSNEILYCMPNEAHA